MIIDPVPIVMNRAIDAPTIAKSLMSWHALGLWFQMSTSTEEQRRPTDADAACGS